MTMINIISKITNQFDVFRIDGREGEGKPKIPGKIINVFKNNMGFQYSSIEVYKDGKIYTGKGELTDLSGLKKQIQDGWIVLRLPDKCKLNMYPFGQYEISSSNNFIMEADFIKQVEDTIRILNKKPTSANICRDLYIEYVNNPSEELENKLKVAYFNVPEHKRQFILGDMDAKDGPIKKILGLNNR